MKKAVSKVKIWSSFFYEIIAFKKAV